MLLDDVQRADALARWRAAMGGPPSREAAAAARRLLGIDPAGSDAGTARAS